MHIPYTYLLKFTNPDSNEVFFYYGVRYASKCNPDDLFKSYFTNSKLVKNLIKNYGTRCFEHEIRKTFPNNPQKAHLWEQNVLRRLDAANRKDFLNKSVGGKVFVMLGEKNPSKRKDVREKISKSLTGKLVGHKNPFFGKAHTQETKEKISKANKGRKLSEETRKKMSLSKIGKKQSNITSLKRSQLFSGSGNPMFGKIGVAKHLNANRIKCPHCGIVANVGNIKRWHMERCKAK